eukprot:685804-Amphidinium_carterae.1
MEESGTSAPSGAQRDVPPGEIATAAVKQMAVATATALELLQPQIQAYAAILRPWKPFLVLQKPRLVGMDMQQHIEQNLSYYQANYLCIASAFLLLSLLIHTNQLVAVCVSVVVWATYVQKGGLDPNWRPKVGDIELASSHRLMLLSAGTIAWIFIMDGEDLLALV